MDGAELCRSVRGKNLSCIRHPGNGFAAPRKGSCRDIAVYHTPDEVEILNIAVREDRRRRGYGSLLMATALQDAKETGILRGVLEVRISNAPAIHLYESFGFRQVGKRRGYYQDTGEDALIYTLDMGQTRTNP